MDVQDFYNKDINTLEDTINKYNLINEINTTIEDITFQSNNIVQTLDLSNIKNHLYIKII